jgi:serine protease Do
MRIEQGSARFAALVTVGALALAGCGRTPGGSPAGESAGSGSAATAPAAAPPAAKPPSPGTNAAAARGLPDFTDLVAKYGPAVVNVSVVERGRNASMQDDGGEDAPEDPLHDFLRRFGVPGQRGGAQPPARGEGSGFVITADGYILTNAHVVADASEVTVRTTDRREFAAKVVGVDRRTDVAVIKINAKDLPTVQLGDPSKLRPGEWVVAIGSPFGFENSVTAGIVSATSRSINDGPESNLTPFIQTDAAVNPGNSGGPLFNMAGEVVGINSQIYSRTGGFMGISFAIPIDVAVNVKDQLIKTGRVQRGRIGVVIQDVNQQLADSFGLDRPRGALVSQVEAGAPGAKAGLKAGDVILSANGKPIDRSSDLPVLIAAQKPGTNVELEVWRDRASRKFTVTVAELKDGRVSRTGGGSDGAASGSDKLGLSVRPLTQQERRAGDIESGLLVEDVDGPALRAGLQAGDVIVGANGQKVASVDDLEAIVGKSKGAIALLVNRNGTTLFVPIRMGG